MSRFALCSAMAFSPPAVNGHVKEINGTTNTYQAVFSFQARQEDELSFEPGDRIVVLSNKSTEIGEGWLFGQCNGRQGLFPENYAKPMNQLSPSGGGSLFPNNDPFLAPTEPVLADPFEDMYPKEEPYNPLQPELPKSNGAVGEGLFYCRALYPYDSNESGDLNFHQGDIIRVFCERENWWTGTLLRNAKQGMFPANFAEKLDASYVPPTGRQASPPHPSAAGAKIETGAELQFSKEWAEEEASSSQPANLSKPEIARVVIAYQAQGPGQLSLANGQLVQIRKKSAKGWWEGELQ
ncbi:hypothetical protein Ciccas_014122, partial [Cichlidogyrus casuarinus]